MNYSPALVQLPLIRECSGAVLKTPEAAYSVCKDLAELAQETFQVLTLNSKNKLINRHMITLGLLDASLVHPREVFRAAILDNSGGVLLIHNHPSGDPTPSADDIRITKQLVEAGRVIDIKVLDHVIVGSGEGAQYLSMREEGVCMF